MKRIAIFGSGAGSNAENIIKHFEDHDDARVWLVVSNRKNAGILDRATRLGVRTMVLTPDGDDAGLVRKLQEARIDLIVLAGYLKLIPQALLEAFPNRIINIHPALLPDYGGPGMYGMRVHEAVIANGEAESGITIHFVNESYDEGEIIFQDTVDIEEGDSAEDLAYKVHQLEYRHYPGVIESILLNLEE
jgi:phosphoribosylglycinamide formyltransferase-1